LLAFQSLAIALVAWPVYALFAPKVGRVAAALFGLAALALTGLLWAGPADFFDANFLPVLVLAMVWAMERRRWGWFAGFAVLSLGVREEVGVTMVLRRGWALFHGYGWRTSLAIAASGSCGSAWWSRSSPLPRRGWTDPKRFFVSMFGRVTRRRRPCAMLAHPLGLARWLASHENLVFLRQLLSLPVFPSASTWRVCRRSWPGRHPSRAQVHEGVREPAGHALALGTFFLAARRVALGVAARRDRLGTRHRDRGGNVALARHDLAGRPPRPRHRGGGGIGEVCPARRCTPRSSCSQALQSRSIRLLVEHVRTRTRSGVSRALRRGAVARRRSRYRRARTSLADSLALDARFVERPGYEPFVVFERR
jgi:hypothetical protein